MEKLKYPTHDNHTRNGRSSVDHDPEGVLKEIKNIQWGFFLDTILWNGRGIKETLNHMGIGVGITLKKRRRKRRGWSVISNRFFFPKIIVWSLRWSEYRIIRRIARSLVDFLCITNWVSLERIIDYIQLLFLI